MSEIRLDVEGMTCGHCVAAATRALEAVPGVASAAVSLEERRAVVQGTADLEALVAALREEGYTARPHA